MFLAETQKISQDASKEDDIKIQAEEI